MTRAALLALVLALAACGSKKSSGTSDCARACAHMLDLAHADLDKNVAELEKSGMGDMGRKLQADARASRESDLATCVSKCQEGTLDTACVLRAEVLDDSLTCAKRE